MLAELEGVEWVRGEGEPSTMTSFGEEDERNEDEETLVSHDHKAATHARVAPPPPRVGLPDLRVAEVASRVESDAYMYAATLRTNGVDVSGLRMRWLDGRLLSRLP